MPIHGPNAQWRDPNSGTELHAIQWSGIDGLAGEFENWNEILKNSAVDPLCNSPRWAISYVKSFVKSQTVFGWTLRDTNDAPVAIFAFREEPPRSRISLRRAIFAVDGTFDSDYLDLPAKTGFEMVACEAAVDLLSSRREIQAVVFAGIPNDSPTLRNLREICTKRGLPRRESAVSCAVAPLAPTFEEYIKSLKPRMRSKVRQSLKNVDGRSAKFEWCHDPMTLNLHLDGLFELHGMRWRAAGRSGSFVDPRRCEFYRKLGSTFLNDGLLRFARLEIGGKAVAYQIGVLAGNVYYQLQEGFHADFGDLRVGTALRARVVEALIAEGVRRYDFMEGESQHKAEWGAVSRPATTVAFALPRLRARVAYWARTWIDNYRIRRGERAKQPSPTPAHEGPPLETKESQAKSEYPMA
ncbi:MAG: GNAT family N-acetyltransferase [Planctomycetes bacterium]|nr:GNAT family N-acetyltransferase [Planctomycetota bacterium]